MNAQCAICSFLDTSPSGGWYFENDFWRLGPHLAPALPGVVLAYLRRHAAGLADMQPEELESMGPTLASAARAIEGAVHPERVYVLMFGEQIRHVHVVLMPRGADVPAEHRSAALMVNQSRYIDPDAALQASERIRSALQPQLSQ